MREKAALASLTVSCLVAGLIVAATGGVSRAEEIGKVSQPLVAGTEVSTAEQQAQALVRIQSPAGGCSGALLNNEWVISAAHCFQNPNVMANQVTVRATWAKSRKASELYILDNDIAILRLAKKFDEIGFDYNMPVFTGTLTPGRALTIYGRGIHILASGKGNSAQPSQSDGKYRVGSFTVSAADDSLITFGPGKGGAIPAGGDSGGPAFINAGGQTYLAGISSSCQTGTVPGKNPPADDWTWVNSISECSYARVGSVWPDIQARIGSNGCRNYAWRAVGAVEMATKVYGCDPATVSGPRWSPNFDDHLNWCKQAKAADANAEDKARTAEMHACRVAAAMPQGTGQLTVAETADGFALSGGGYPVNSRIIIRVKGPAAVEQNITSNFSDPQGNFAATLSAAKVCAGEGQIIFTAEDQDRPPSPPVNMACKAVQVAGAAGAAPEPAVDPVQPAPQPLKLKKLVTVKLDVDLYDAPGGGGQVIGMLGAGTRGVRLLDPCADDWCHVGWSDGEGWVYSGPGYQSLKLP